MHIDVAELPRDGRTWSFDGSDAAVRALVAASLDGAVDPGPDALRVSLTAVRRGAGVEVVVEGAARATRPCDRCGEPAAFAVEARETLVFRPRSELPSEAEVALDASDLDLGFYDGVTLDADDPISELFALHAPARVTCGGAACAEARDASSSGESIGGHPAFAALKGAFKGSSDPS